VTAKELLISDGDVLIMDICHKDIPFVYTSDKREIVADMFIKYGLLSLPVTDMENRLVGIITFDDIYKVIEKESANDIARIGAVIPHEDTYLKTGVFRHTGNRIIWLLFLMVSGMITGSILSGFETTLSQWTILYSFVPMLMDTGGNAGSQSSTLVIRGMAIGELTTGDFLKIWWKEIRVSLLCATALVIVNIGRMAIFRNTREVGYIMVVSIALAFTVIIAKSVGCILPVIAKKCKADPAVMAAPLITTIVDALSLLVYVGAAKLLMPLFL
jgi:magnesium transporter